MALNTATNRFSMLNFSSMDDALPVPNNDINQGDRQTFLTLYNAIAADPPTVDLGTVQFLQNRKCSQAGFM